MSSVQFSRSVMSICDPMNCSMPGLSVHHQLPEFTQTHVHQVCDAIQPSHALSSPFPPAPIPPSIRFFSNESTLRMRWPKYWSFSFSIIPSKEIPGLGTNFPHLSPLLSFIYSFENIHWKATMSILSTSNTMIEKPSFTTSFQHCAGSSTSAIG